MQVNWIEINLPFYISDPLLHSSFFSQNPYPDLTEKIKEKFGQTAQESAQSISSILIDPIFNEEESKFYLDKHREFVFKLASWELEHPEVKEWDRKRKLFVAELESKSFCGRQLNKPGTLIELDNDGIYLLGTHDFFGGVSSGDIDDIPDSAIVKRYAVVFDYESFLKIKCSCNCRE